MWSGISRFFGNLTGGFIGESDEERRRKEAAARARRQNNTPRPPASIAAPSYNPLNNVASPGRINQQNRPQAPAINQQQFTNPVSISQPSDQELLQTPQSLLRPELRDDVMRARFRRDEPKRMEEAINSDNFVERFNQMAGKEQKKYRKALEDKSKGWQSGDTKGQQDYIRANRLLENIDKYGKDNRSMWEKAVDFGGDFIGGMAENAQSFGRGLGYMNGGLDAINQASDQEYENLKQMNQLYKQGRITKAQYQKFLQESAATQFDLTRQAEEATRETDPVRQAANVALMGADAATGGVLPSVFRGAGKTVGTRVLQSAVGGAGIGSVYGGIDSVAQGGQQTQAGDIMAGIAVGTVFGGVLGSGVSLTGEVVRAAKDRLTREMIQEAQENAQRPLTNEERNQIQEIATQRVEEDAKIVRDRQKQVEQESAVLGDQAPLQRPQDPNLPEIAETFRQNEANLPPEAQARLQELRKRQERYQRDPEAVEAVLKVDERPREPGYDPSNPVSRENVAQRLAAMGLTRKDVNVLKQEGANARLLQKVLDTMEGKQIDNPMGYMRNAIRRMKQESKDFSVGGTAKDKSKPALNDKGEVIVDQNGKPLSQAEVERLNKQEARQVDGETNKVIDDSTDEATNYAAQVARQRMSLDEVPEQHRQAVIAELYGDNRFMPQTKAMKQAQEREQPTGPVESNPAKETTKPQEPYTYRDEEGNTVTGFRDTEIVDDLPPVDAYDEADKTFKNVKTAMQNKPTDGTYQSEAKFVKDVDNYAKKLGQRVSERAKADGGSFEEMVKEVDGLWARWKAEMAENGKSSLSVKDISPKHRGAYQMLRKELDAMYGNRQGQIMEGRKQDGFGDQGPFYVPHRSAKEAGDMTTIDQLNGLNRDYSVNTRTTGAIEDMDYSPNLVRKYAIEMMAGDKAPRAEAMAKQSADNAKKGIGRQLSEEEAMAAVKQQDEFYDRLAKAARIEDGEKLSKFDSVEEIKKLGEAEGLKRETIDATMNNAWYNESYRRLGSVQHHGKSIDKHGISQYWNAKSDARGLLDGVEKDIEISDLVQGHIKKDLEYIDDKEINSILKSLDRNLKSIPEDAGNMRSVQVEAMAKALRDAARVNQFNMLKRVEITDPNLRKLINLHANRMFVAERAENTFGAKIAGLLTNLQDMGLRGWNIKSFMVETSDITQLNSFYGVKHASKAIKDVSNPKAIDDMLKKYGKEDSYAVHRETMKGSNIKGDDLDDFYKALAGKDPRTALSLVKRFGDPRLLIKEAEKWKTSVALRAAEMKFEAQGLKGVELHRAVLDEVRRTAILNDAESFLKIQQNPYAAAAFQYWQWNVRFNAQNMRVALGREKVANVKDGKSRARFMAYQAAQRTALWGALATSGSSAAYAFGLFDPFGILEDNWDGIRDEDMTAMDHAMQWTSFSPLTSLLGSAYFAHRQEQERAEAFADNDEEKQATYGWRERKADNERLMKDEKLSPEEKEKLRQEQAKFSKSNVVEGFQQRTPFGNFMPGITQTRKTTNYTGVPKKIQEWVDKQDNKALDLALSGFDLEGVRQRGYDESRDGRVRYQAPEKGSFHDYYAMAFGKGATKEAREYYDRTDMIKGLSKSAQEGNLNAFVNELRKDVFFDSTIGKIFGGSTKNNHRPLSSSFDGGFNKAAIDAFNKSVQKHGVHSKEARQVMGEWLQIGRKYNRVLDDFKKANPTDYAQWQKTFDENIISPEKWAIYESNPKVWEFAKSVNS